LAKLHPVSAQLAKTVLNFSSETGKAATPVRRVTARPKAVAVAEASA
jgi:hypothetical protein